MSTPLEILKQYWNYESFKHPQEEIISSVINKKDTIALLPTGGGKSICFQLPILLQEGICIVISPLIALMNDQVNGLLQKGIKAVALTSKLSEGEIVTIFDNLQFGGYKFLYLSPEKLQSEFIKEKLRHLNIQLIAIDEAHCISEWGHDFRPSYLNIHLIRELHPTIPIIALTASATEKVTTDIITNLKLDAPSIIKKSFYRDNLAYQIFTVEDKLYKLQQILTKIRGPKIIYTNTRKKTIEISTRLNQLNFKTTFYHGGMTMDEKIKSYEDWMSENKPIIVATNAFGMGIDKPNVRAIIHNNLHQRVENYMQEA
jgi:ATP-dependent DNA helicase RecQ